MGPLLQVLTTLTLLAVLVSSLSIGKVEELNAKKYLHNYGYVGSYSELIPIAPEAIKVFQSYANVPITGKLDSATIKRMGDPRCGMADLKVETSSRVRRYVHQGTNWKPLFRSTGKMELRWTLLNTARRVRYEDALDAMRNAFFFWNEKTDIDFIEVPKDKVGQTGYEKKDIEILVSFASGSHDGPFPFDGPGRTLAHAFYPLTNTGLSGDVHFDDDEDYSYKSTQGKNLLWVATHEIGHSLGLEHSRNRDAVMYPWYTSYNPDMKLLDDDILGIQTLYGSRSKPAPPRPGSQVTTPKPTLPPANKGRCPTYGKLTAVYYSDLYKQEFAFTDQHKIYFLGYDKRIPVVNRFNYYPRVTVPGTIDAMFTLEGFQKLGFNQDKYQFIFNNEGRYFMYHGFSRSRNTRDGYSIHNGLGPLKLKFPTRIRKIDAVFNAVFNGRTYFFSGTEYWRYDNRRRRFDSGYPKNIKQYWGGLPATVDAAYSSPDKSTTYFLAEGKYYLYDDVNIRVKSVHEISSFLRCDGAAAITDNSSRGGSSGLVGLLAGPAAGSLSVGSLGASKPQAP